MGDLFRVRRARLLAGALQPLFGLEQLLAQPRDLLFALRADRSDTLFDHRPAEEKQTSENLTVEKEKKRNGIECKKI